MKRLKPGALAAVLATALTGTALLATMYLTEFDARWVTFLAGVAVAAVLASVSAASHAQWRLMRRTVELRRAREKLREELARGHRAMAAFKSAEARLRLLGSAVPWPVFLVDADEVVRFHNAAAVGCCALPAVRVDGAPLRVALGEAGYRRVEHRLATSPSSDAGICLVLAPEGGSTALGPDTTHGRELLVPGEGGALVYLRATTQESGQPGDARAKLVEALRDDRFLLLAQRIVPVDIGAPDPLCYEVLLRLQEEEDNLLPPGGFLPVAARYGLLEELDRWVVQHLVNHCVARQRADPTWRAPLFCVNLSKAALASALFAVFVREQLSHGHLDGRALCFELDEADVVNARDAVVRLIGTLKPLGCRFSLTSFGAMGVSFAGFQGLAFDFLKIDRAVVRNFLRDAAAAARFKAINSVCHRIGLRTIAEFVEDDETLAAVRRAGVDYVQGFGVARPERLTQVDPPPRARISLAASPDGAETALG